MTDLSEQQSVLPMKCCQYLARNWCHLDVCHATNCAYIDICQAHELYEIQCLQMHQFLQYTLWLKEY